MSWISKIALPLVLSLPLIVLLRGKKESARDKILRNRSIVNFDVFNAKRLQQRLDLRARPNARLIAAFDIDNSFTTTDEATHKDFLRRARAAISNTDLAAWRRCQKLAGDVLDSVDDRSSRALNLQRVTRVMCLHVVLELLFPEARVPAIDVDAADHITAHINRLWLESKGNDFERRAGCRALQDLRSRLQQMVPAAEDPLALLIPAYETLWRVVMLTYVHVAFRRLDKSATAAVEAVVSSLNGEGMSFGKHVEMFSKEALRLYPPTKRIYRASEAHTLAADVESLHHDERIWGPTRLEFRPGRFVQLTTEQRDAYMPFGAGPHTCPAAQGFATSIIALLVAALVERLGAAKDGASIWFDQEGLDSDDAVPLPTGRDEMEGWTIRPARG